eukprot:6937398-Prymnesium_polylepis.1
MTANHAGSLAVVESWALPFYHHSVLFVARLRVAWQRFQRPLVDAVHARWSKRSPHPCSTCPQLVLSWRVDFKHYAPVTRLTSLGSWSGPIKHTR